MSNAKKHFRTKLKDKTLEKCISQFECLEEINSEEVDLAFETYLRGPYITKLAKNEVERVFELMKDGKLLGVAVEAHEKWEVLEYLKKGYTLEEISNGVAHENYRPYAHAEARFKEYSLYKFLYQKQFLKDSPPMHAYLLVCPLWELFIEECYKMEIKPEHLDYMLGEFGHHEKPIRSEKCSKEDLENALKFFEKNGYEYKDKAKMLRRAEDFIN